MKAYDILKARGVSRLCHFTKFKSLTHIIPSADGILASDSIRPDTKNVTDKARYDGEPDFVCCSVEYPNSWFLNSAKQKDNNQIFREWVALYIDLEILNQRVAKYCPCNASKSSGHYIDSNMDNVASIFETSVTTFMYPRSLKMLSCCPTDGQAEIMIKDNIPRDYIIGIAVSDKEIARRIYSMLKTCGVKQIPLYVAPEVLDTSWSNMIKNGQRPSETTCVWSGEE